MTDPKCPICDSRREFTDDGLFDWATCVSLPLGTLVAKSGDHIELSFGALRSMLREAASGCLDMSALSAGFVEGDQE